MTLMRPLLWLLLAAFVAALPARAQETGEDSSEPAVLVADQVFLDGNEQLVATGNVEAMFGNRRLQAEKIIYDRASDKLILTGPIVIHEGDETLVLASSAELDEDFESGILRGARVVMGDHVQLAAQELVRSGARYNQLVKTAVTSCKVCEDGRKPLWQIRATRVIHDQEEKQLYFENAQFRVLNTPLFYLPRLRLPDPTLERATGFLVPSIHSSSLLGTGVKVPYFIKIGDHRDLTLTPFITTETRTLEWRYRQAFKRGRIEFEGAFSDDDINSLGSDSQRAYVFGNGKFDLGNRFKLRFDIELVNNDTYLLDYGYSAKTRLDSAISIDRTTRLSYGEAKVTYYEDLRIGVDSTTLPRVVTGAEYEQRLPSERLGGEFRIGVDIQHQFRTSDLSTDGVDFDRWADGRDVTRFTLDTSYHRAWTLAGGVLANLTTGLSFDHFDINQSGTTSLSSANQVTPSVEVELRWPLIREGANSTDVLEPMLQLAWVGGRNPFVPNDESTQIEFDEGNLLSTSRFTAPDRRERGFFGAYGVQWTRFMNSGWKTSLAMGQVIREEEQLEFDGTDSFSRSSGLNDRVSDMVIAGQVRSNNGLAFTARALLDEDFDTSKAEARASWATSLTTLSASYIYLDRDPVENRFDKTSEWWFDASYRFSRHWTGSANWRYDASNDQNISGGIGIKYTNECVDVKLTAQREFTSTATLEPSTDINLTVGLRGFTVKSTDSSYTRTCSK